MVGPAGALYSSLKKHTNLLNKLKTNLFASPADALLKDIDGLTLTKYLEEIVAAVVEGSSKGKGDIDSAVEVSWVISLASIADKSGHCSATYAINARFPASPSTAIPSDPQSSASPYYGERGERSREGRKGEVE